MLARQEVVNALLRKQGDPMSDMKDQGLTYRVHAAIAKRSYLFGNNIQIEASADAVTLKGSVSSWYDKQIAQETLRDVEGLASINNELVVSS